METVTRPLGGDPNTGPIIDARLVDGWRVAICARRRRRAPRSPSAASVQDLHRREADRERLAGRSRWSRRRPCSGAGSERRSPAAPTPAGRRGSTCRCRFRRRGPRHLHRGHAAASAASRQLPAVRSTRTRPRRDGGRCAFRDGGPPRGGRWPQGGNTPVHRPDGGHSRLRRAGEPVGGRAAPAVAGRRVQPAGGGEVAGGTRPEAVAVTRRSIGRPRAAAGGAASGGVVLTTLADHQGLDVLACCVACERYVPLELAALAERLGWDAPLYELRPRLRCRRCGARTGRVLIRGRARAPGG